MSWYQSAAATGNDTPSAMATTDLSTGVANVYYVGIKNASGKAVDKGTYTLRFRFTDANGFITDKTASVKFVTSAADSGAVITLAQSGSLRVGETPTVGAVNKITATLRDANGGKIQKGLSGSAPTAYNGIAPTLGVAVWTGSTSALDTSIGDSLTAVDNGIQNTSSIYQADFYSATASDTVTAYNQYADGIYGIVFAGSSSRSGLGTPVSTTAPTLRVTYGSVLATKALTLLSAASGAGGTPVITATGLAASSASPSWTVPLTTKSVTYTLANATAGATYTYKVTWTKTATGDQSVASGVSTTVYGNSDGNVVLTITNANPIDGATATVNITGFTSTITDQVITWSKSTASSMTVTLDGAYVAKASTNKFVARVVDAFGAPVAGVVLQPSLVSGSANYSATATYASVVTGADGTASFSLTDAAAAAGDTDSVKFTDLAGVVTAVTSTITYAATAPAPTSLTAYYNVSASSATTTNTTIAVPASGGLYATTAGDKFHVVTSKNTGVAVTVANSTSTTGDQVAIKIAAGVAGAAVTATASAGAYIVGTDGFAATSVTKYASSTGNALFVVGSNATGANTITFTSGTATKAVAFWVTNGASQARFLKLTQNASTGAVVAQVTDRYGNGVASVDVQIGTDNGTLGNGQMTTVYKTDADGKVSVLPVGLSGDTANITALLSTSGDETANSAGYVSTTAVDSTLAAGNRTATLAVKLGASGTDAATAATDAANEATDAANAATDAANAAAEAADAATAAAQDAQAAVAALASQVADLIAGIKAQITALTNLVIKIQKKVKA